MTYSDVRMDGREEAKQGAIDLARLVSITMGPYGRRVGIGGPGQIGFATKDGHTVAKFSYDRDPHRELGRQVLKSAMEHVAGSAADATTQTALLTMRLLESAGNGSRKFVEELLAAADIAVDGVRALSRPVADGDVETLSKVATTSCNNDPVLGAIMADTMSKVGKDGLVKISGTGKFIGVKTTVSTGYSIRTGYITEFHKRSVNDVIHSPLIYVTEDAITEGAVIAPCLDRYSEYVRSLKEGETPRTLLIVCSKATDKGAEQIGKAKSIKIKNVDVPVDVRAIWTNKFDELQDISIVAGAKLFASYNGTGAGVSGKYKGDDFFGSVRSVTITPQGTMFLFDRNERIDQHVESLVTDTERRSKLTRGIGLVEVGAETGAEIEDKCHLLEDAEGSCRGALQSGVVPGGGWTHDTVSRSLPDTEGGRALASAMKGVFEHLCNLAEMDGTELTASDVFNFITRKHEPIETTPVLDAAKSITEAIHASCSVVAQILNLGATMINHQS